MLGKFKYHILLFFGLLIGGLVLQSLLNSFYRSEEQQHLDRLNKAQSDAVLKVEAGINVYATVVSSIRAFIENSEEFPTEVQLQSFLNDLVKEVNFKDSIIVSWVDTNQIFRYVITPKQIDPHNLKGINVGKLRPDFEIRKLNALMHQDNISLFDPINLREGWAAFPFNFSARNKNGEILGYIAPVLNVKYLLDYPYRGGYDSLFVHRFAVGGKVNLTREAVYDGTTIYNKNNDDQYYKNFNISEEDFVYTDINFYGLNLKVGSAYKHSPHIVSNIAIITYLWFGLLCAFCILTLNQFRRNTRLNLQLKEVNKAIALKNQQMEGNLYKIQTLIKEIHHRVKNNMQIISSLLNLQSNEEQQDEKVIKALDKSKARIQSIALVHHKLYGAQDLVHINVLEYIEQLVDSVENTLNRAVIKPNKTISVPPDLFFNMDTMVPLGLVLNELVTNSYKYAFKETETNSIFITLTQMENDYLLTYADSGPGIPDHIDLRNSGTLGLELIHILTEQIGGKVEYEKANKSTFLIKFKTIMN